jgi:hypothetical protein
MRTVVRVHVVRVVIVIVCVCAGAGSALDAYVKSCAGVY